MDVGRCILIWHNQASHFWLICIRFLAKYLLLQLQEMNHNVNRLDNWRRNRNHLHITLLLHYVIDCGVHEVFAHREEKSFGGHASFLQLRV